MNVIHRVPLASIALLSCFASAQFISPTADWPPKGAHFVQTSPPTTSTDGLAMSGLDMSGWTEPVALKKGLNAVNVKLARMSGVVSMGDGSVHKLDGTFDASFSANYTDTTNGIDNFDLDADVVEYKDGEDGVMHTRPGNHKPGKMTVQRTSGGEYRITSFFDVFLDLSFDGGKSFHTMNDAVEFNLQPAPEPATMAVLGLGAFGLMRRRK